MVVTRRQSTAHKSTSKSTPSPTLSSNRRRRSRSQGPKVPRQKGSKSPSKTPSTPPSVPTSVPPFVPTYLELIAESFTTSDNLTHNHSIQSQPFWVRIAFISTNIFYPLAAYFISSRSQKTLPLHSSLSPLCSNPSVSLILIILISLASTSFHTCQCFHCLTTSQMSLTVFLNQFDLLCASTYGFYLSICFYKRSALHFIPCLLLLLAGGVLKLKGYYKGYFLAHGMWHVGGAWYFTRIICGESDRLL